jgi:hypothetical protein
MLFHQAYRFVGIVIDPTGDDVPGHNLTDSRGVGIAILSDKLENYVAIRNHSFQTPALQVVKDWNWSYVFAFHQLCGPVDGVRNQTTAWIDGHNFTAFHDYPLPFRDCEFL